MQAAGRLRAAPPAPLTEPATVRTQARDVLQEAFEAARVRSRRALTPAVRARVQLIHRPVYQLAPSPAMGQAEQLAGAIGPPYTNFVRSAITALQGALARVVVLVLDACGGGSKWKARGWVAP